MPAPNYNLTFSVDLTSWTLVINGTTVVSNRTTMPNKPSIVYMFANNGYGELMSDGHTYCPTDAAYKNAHEVFVSLGNDKKITR